MIAPSPPALATAGQRLRDAIALALPWPVASMAILAVALGVGWLAYERARPSARMIALVATLAALAALGRDAFVALPDVKPITAITLVCGYALGPLAGFTVGALGMLASNVLLGQGPYTPWQMAAWGAVGLLGALLGAASRRRLGRIALGLACALSALMAKEVMNVYAWTIGGIYTPAALLARAAEGLPFDITDTVASLLFGLAFAPELARLLARARARMTVRWEPRMGTGASAALLLAALLAAGLARGGPAGQLGGRLASERAEASAIRRASAYLAGAQNDDGGFGGAPGEPSAELYSAWAAIGLAAAGEPPADVAKDGHSALAAIAAQAGTLEGLADMERTAVALRASGANPRTLGSIDIERRILAARRPDGSFGGEVNTTAFAVIALRAEGKPADDPLLRDAARWLAGEQSPGGGFSFAGRSTRPDVDDTAAVVEALVATAPSPTATIAAATSYLIGAQSPDGGFPQEPGSESNAQSTAWAVQALDAAGVALPSRDGRSPLRYLQSLQARDGSIRYSRASSQTPVWVTAEALGALAARPLPIAPVEPPADAEHAEGGARSGRPRAAGAGGTARNRPAGHPRPRTLPAAETPGAVVARLAGALTSALRSLAVAARTSLGLDAVDVRDSS